MEHKPDGSTHYTGAQDFFKHAMKSPAKKKALEKKTKSVIHSGKSSFDMDKFKKHVQKHTTPE